jgi:hypothetical protein
LHITAIIVVARGESRVIQRKTQSAEYWHSFTLTPDDVAFLRNLLLDATEPSTTEALASAIVRERVRLEETEIRGELTRGTPYQPRNSYALGEDLLFPALDFRLGKVVSVRPGDNPEYGHFDVITVDFGPDRRQRSFAASLASGHKLNVDPSDLLRDGDLLGPEKLLATVAAQVPQRLAQQLRSEPLFATFEDRWLLSDALAEVHVGHLNISEALIEVRSQPIETTALVRELDLPSDVPPGILAFSVQSALAKDDRFDQVGTGDTRAWFLKRIEPSEALTVPPALHYRPISYDREALTVELLQLEWELDDEWSEDSSALGSQRMTVPSTTLLLTYPHLISGTLPLSGRGRTFFPAGHGKRTMVTLIDGRWGSRFPAWTVHSSRYIAGLRPWFDQHKLPAGALIMLERRPDTDEVVVDFRPKRMRREWTRMAQVVDGDRFDFQMRKQAISCEYDEQVIIGVEDDAAISQLATTPAYAEGQLDILVYQIFVDLAGLSQQGSVHAKTLYSAVNVVRRCPPGPIFSILASDQRIESIGDGLYRLSGSQANG